MPVCYHYVYILESVAFPERYYVGTTQDMKARLKKHNEGSVPHTAKHRPWRVKNTISFRDRRRAVDFERYLKSHSGRAFAKKRFVFRFRVHSVDRLLDGGPSGAPSHER